MSETLTPSATTSRAVSTGARVARAVAPDHGAEVFVLGRDVARGAVVIPGLTQGGAQASFVAADGRDARGRRTTI